MVRVKVVMTLGIAIAAGSLRPMPPSVTGRCKMGVACAGNSFVWDISAMARCTAISIVCVRAVDQ